MGANQQKEAVVFFTSVTTRSSPLSREEMAAGLARYHKELCSGNELYSVALPIVVQLMVQEDVTLRTTRIPWILQYCLDVFHPLVQQRAAAGEVELSALRMVEIMIRLLWGVAREPVAAPLLLGSVSPQQQGPASVHALCAALMAYTVQVSVTAATALTHAAVVRLLLSMTSSALHHSTAVSEHPMDCLTAIILSSSELLKPFIMVLLQRLVVWGADVRMNAPLFYRDSERGILRTLFNFGLGSGGGTPTVLGGATRLGKSHRPPLNSCSSAETMFRHSAQLLCVLVVYQKGSGGNPALDTVQTLEDSPVVPFKPLAKAIAVKLTGCPCLSLLLYVLLYNNPSFVHTLLTESPGSLVDIVVEVLRLTHTACRGADTPMKAAPEKEETVVAAPEVDSTSASALHASAQEMTQFSYPFLYFMTSTLLLILSEDRTINTLLCDTPCSDLSFAVDRPTGDVTVGAMCLIVLSSSISKALNDRNEPLAAVLVPCMANISTFVHDLEVSTAQRLIALLLMILKKLRRVEEALCMLNSGEDTECKSPNLTAPSTSTNPLLAEDVRTVKAVGEMYVRQLSMTTEAMEGILRGPHRGNEALIYELLYHREKIFGALTPSACSEGVFLKPVGDALQNMVLLLQYYEAEIASAPKASTSKDIIAIIRRGCNGQEASSHIPPMEGSLDNIVGTVDLLYTYEESPLSYDFFGPFVWATLLDDAYYPGGILWSTRVSRLSLFARA